MSSTNRGGKRSEADFYPTPLWCVRRLFEALPQRVRTFKRWLEPAAGDGAIIRAADPYLGRGACWDAAELRETPHSFGGATVDLQVCDYMDRPAPGARYQIAITNPPFSLAIDFFHKMRAEAQRVVLLTRLNWIGNKDRAIVLRQDMPEIYVMPNRPSFSGKGTDSIEYAWLIWGLTRRETGSVRILPDTPLVERQKG